MDEHPNAVLVETFYTAFARRDAAAMAACYHADCEFSDPVFTSLRGPQVGAMWAMLCARAKDFKLEYSGIEAGNDTGHAHWVAHYTFSGTGRPVHNIIESAFTFRDGLILRHVDRFDLWRWAGMALGVKGRLSGWLPMVQDKIRAQAMHGLEKYMKDHAKP